MNHQKSRLFLLFIVFSHVTRILCGQTGNPPVPAKDSIMNPGGSHESKKRSEFITYLSSYPKDTRDLFIRPLHWRTGEIIGATAVIAGTTFLVTQDKAINNFFRRNQNPDITNASTYFFSPLGNGIIALPALGIFFGVGVIGKDAKAKETALKGLEAYLLTAVFTQVIKQVTHRHRPYQDTPPNPYLWEGPFSSFYYNSFPSGHSSCIFAIATVISMEYRHYLWVPLVCYSLAGMTAVCRLWTNDHWASDVLFGSALGYGIGSLVYHNAHRNIEILPVSAVGPGATIIYHIR
jgi:membrane-associated phospholipid phosphatase